MKMQCGLRLIGARACAPVGSWNAECGIKGLVANSNELIVRPLSGFIWQHDVRKLRFQVSGQPLG